ncbi:MAG: sensor histidine kinase [Myxococcales bacterium]|nr:sensor histidine kinase [Myxococcales bacterium]
MIPLVVGASAVGSLGSPAVYYLQKRHEMVSTARGEAARVAVILQDVVLQRPLFWRYDTSKIAERLTSEGVGQHRPLIVLDARGVRIPLGSDAPPEGVLWGKSEVYVAGKHQATVWIGVSTQPLLLGTLTLGAVSALLSTLLGGLLYLIPTRAIAAAERRISALVAQLSLTLQEEERGRIARDLHDGAGQALTAARLHLASLRKGASAGLSVERLAAVAGHIDEAMEEIRRSTAALRPPALAELGLRGALERHGEAVAAAAGIEVCWSLELPTSLEAHLETALYRIIQEALTNVARHARASRVSVVIRREGRGLQLIVEDDGRGVNPGQARGGGLASIEERARLLGGKASFLVGSPGFRVEVELPMEVE